MKFELDRNDLVSLVLGADPNYDVMNHPKIEPHGSYTGGHSDRWSWQGSYFKGCSEEDLFEIYTICKNSWSKLNG